MTPTTSAHAPLVEPRLPKCDARDDAHNTRPLKEHGNAYRLFDANGEDLKYVHDAQSWPLWDGAARRLAMALLEELEIATGDNALLRDLGRLMHAPDANGIDTMNQIYRKVITLSSRVDVMIKLSDIFKALIALERGAFGIDRKEADTGGAIDALIKRVMVRQRADCF